jgi:hypothetical protein
LAISICIASIAYVADWPRFGVNLIGSVCLTGIVSVTP